VTKEELITHFHAQYWRYLLLFALVLVFCVASAPMFAPRVPPEETVTVRFFGGVYVYMEDGVEKEEHRAVYMNAEVGALEDELIAALPGIRKITLQSGELYGSDLSLLSMSLQGLLPGYADVMIGQLPVDEQEQQSSFRPLDQFFEDGTFPAALREYAETDAGGNVIALSASPLRRLERKDIMTLRGAACAIPLSSKNPHGAAEVIAWFYENALT